MFKMNKKGFTLVELLVVLAILGILAAIGIPQYVKVMERSKIGADYARIATVQTAFDAFVSEVGGIGNVKVGLTTSVNSTGINVSSPAELNGTSVITNLPVTFEAFWDGENVFPTLKSTELTPTQWIVKTGTSNSGIITAIKQVTTP